MGPTIDEYLENGNPIVVGVNHTLGRTDNENTTDHFIVIVGRGYDEIAKQNYYVYFDVGTEHQSKGTNPNNRLYLDDKTGLLTGKSAVNPARTYTVTQVRRYGK